MSWDAGAYLRFANERTQPSIDLIERIRSTHPRRIIDLGCGPGNSTEPLRQRWPEAAVIGLDSSAPMIEAARKAYPSGTWLMGTQQRGRLSSHSIWFFRMRCCNGCRIIQEFAGNGSIRSRPEARSRYKFQRTTICQ